ncbi:MAG: hypothetical protein P8L83_02750 [Flavobacteriaceae bacterium]|nr:hypothetical protein [Flavobacteriaceae bacterium]
MKIVKSLFEFYLQSSLHVSFAVWALYKISFIYIDSSDVPYLDCLIVTSSIVGYNKIKYGSIFLKNRKLISNEIILISFLAFVVGFWCFIQVDLLIKSIFIICFAVVVLYVIPNPSSNKSLRNTNGIKIFLVAFSWTLVSYLSLINEMNAHNFFHYLVMGIQRFIFVVVATIPFEIRDINFDKSELGTLPQKFGIFKSKLFGFLLLTLNSFFLYFIEDINFYYKIIEFIIYLILAYTLFKTTKNKSLNYTRFWIEGIPVFWLFNLLLLSQLF